MFLYLGLCTKPLVADKVYWVGRYCAMCHPVFI
ncbi:MAG: hypothetical protein ACJA0B_000686 [Alcanivorax borkumensis]|jgi:hypothetical protein